MSAYDRDNLLKDLRENVVAVYFTKVNGEKREMRCTLMPSLLPPTYVTEEADVKKFHDENRDVLAVWDVMKGGWRSFRIDSIEYVQVLDPYQYF
jgi:hypothetical protein